MATEKHLRLKRESLSRRRRHVRARVSGTPERPRLIVHKSLKQTYASLVDDVNGKVLTGASTSVVEAGKKLEKAAKLGEMIAARAKEKGIESVVFDRSGHRYHGRVKAVAEGARKGGLKF